LYWFDILNTAAERWGISQRDLVWEMPYVTLLYRFHAMERHLPKHKDDAVDTSKLPDVATLGLSGLNLK
jgi:hypothetical protein